MSITAPPEMTSPRQQDLRFPEPPRSMDRARFVDLFGGIYEHSPWVAERVFERGLSGHEDFLSGLCKAMAAVVDESGVDRQLELLRAHPDLAGRAALAGELTAASSGEQSRAGLDQCSPSELAEFQLLNHSYLEKFGFPFIVAVKGLDRQQILSRFRQRLEHGPEQEFATALDEVHKIARLRLQELCNG